jgi:hypothetical protein
LTQQAKDSLAQELNGTVSPLVEDTQRAARVDRINAEVSAILGDSSVAERPVLRLMEHSLRIRGDLSWPKADADEVAATVLRILLTLLRAAGS